MAQDNLMGITEGLFGVRPATFDTTFANALPALKGMSAVDIGTAAAYAGGKGLAQGIAGMMGIQSPEEAASAQARQIAQELTAQGININSSQGMKMLAQRLTQLGAYREAQLAANYAAKYEEQEAATGLKEAQTFQAIQKGIQATREKDPEVVRLQNMRDELEAKYGPTDRRVIELNRIIEGKSKAGQTNISIDQKGQTAFAQGLGAEDAKRVNNAEKLIDAASSTLTTLKKMAETEQLGVISGTGSAARIEALKFLDTAGFTTPKEKNRLANSENFNKLTGDLILERIKQLGTNPSNADREFISKIVPQLESSPQARKQLIQYMADRANQVVKEATTLSDYGRRNQGLGGYKPSIPLVDVSPGKKDISEYSIQELEELRKTARPAGAK